MTVIAEKPPETTEQIEKRLLSDYDFYAESLLRIIDKKTHLIPLKRNRIQKIISAIKQHIKSRGLHIRLIILKGRQFGVSTDQLGENLYKTSTNFNKTALFIAHEPQARTHLFDIVKRMHDNIPNEYPEWKPPIKKSNTTELEFQDINSCIRVGVAGSENTGSSQTINYLHLSEISKYPPHTVSSLLTSVLQCVPKDDPDSEVVMESTANGIGGEFYTNYWGARYQYDVYLQDDGKVAWKYVINPDAPQENEYASLFIPWFCHEEYQMDPDPGFVRTKTDHPIYGNEEQLVALYHINDCHLAWRRNTIANPCKGKLSTFWQEYPCNAREAFLATGRPIFEPIRMVEERMRKCKPAIAYYTLLGGQWIVTQPMAGNTDGLLQVWEEPRPGGYYVVPADVSEGLEHGDFDSASVIDFYTGVQVAHWHGHTSPDMFGVILFYMGQRYGYAWVAPERNNHGLTTITKLIDMNYQNVVPELNMKPGEPARPHYGFWTGASKTGGKALIIDEFAAAFRANPEIVNCAKTCEEMLTFKHKPDGTMGAEESQFDDRVIEMSIGTFVRKRLPAPPLPTNAITGGGGQGQNVTKIPPPPSAWT